jgi:uncharacterized membrane protein YkvA (DUF1232 family)
VTPLQRFARNARAVPKGWQARTAPDSRPLHVLHIGKTGGTALKHALLEHRNSSGYELLLHGHDVRLANIPPGERFMFAIRDPLGRFVSAFNGRLREDRPRYHYPWREEERLAFALFRTPNDLAVALSASDRMRRNQAEAAMRGIGHVKSTYSLWFPDEHAFLSRVPDLFFIAFQERLDEDFEQLKQKLGLPPELELPKTELDAHQTPLGFDKELNAVARGNLRGWYARDLAFVEVCRTLAPFVNPPEEPRSDSRAESGTRPSAARVRSLLPRDRRLAPFPVALSIAVILAWLAKAVLMQSYDVIWEPPRIGRSAWALGVPTALLLAWTLGVALLALRRRDDARAVARFIPDCLVLTARLLKDSRVPRRRRLLLLLLLGYLALPIDPIPDVIPVVGQLDDVLVFGFVMRRVLRASGELLLRQHWPGPDNSLRLVLRFAGR